MMMWELVERQRKEHFGHRLDSHNWFSSEFSISLLTWLEMAAQVYSLFPSFLFPSLQDVAPTRRLVLKTETASDWWLCLKY